MDITGKMDILKQDLVLVDACRNVLAALVRPNVLDHLELRPTACMAWQAIYRQCRSTSGVEV